MHWKAAVQTWRVQLGSRLNQIFFLFFLFFKKTTQPHTASAQSFLINQFIFLSSWELSWVDKEKKSLLKLKNQPLYLRQYVRNALKNLPTGWLQDETLKDISLFHLTVTFCRQFGSLCHVSFCHWQLRPHFNVSYVQFIQVSDSHVVTSSAVLAMSS